MNAVNYDKLMQDVMREQEGKRLLLHSCCAPCSSYCLSELHTAFRVTVFYFNPNLDSPEEYAHRKSEQIRFLQETGYADFLDCDYSPELFARAVKGLEGEREGGARCKVCFELRLRAVAEAAKKGGYDLFGTTLTVSPLKNAARINEIGFALERELGVKYLPSDFKKRGGYLKSVELSKEYDLYRQDYCGCEYSKRQIENRP